MQSSKRALGLVLIGCLFAASVACRDSACVLRALERVSKQYGAFALTQKSVIEEDLDVTRGCGVDSHWDLGAYPCRPTSCSNTMTV